MILYKKQTCFQVIGASHTISPEGWTTNIKGQIRVSIPKQKEENSIEGVQQEELFKEPKDWTPPPAPELPNIAAPGVDWDSLFGGDALDIPEMPEGETFEEWPTPEPAVEEPIILEDSGVGDGLDIRRDDIEFDLDIDFVGDYTPDEGGFAVESFEEQPDFSIAVEAAAVAKGLSKADAIKTYTETFISQLTPEFNIEQWASVFEAAETVAADMTDSMERTFAIMDMQSMARRAAGIESFNINYATVNGVSQAYYILGFADGSTTSGP